MRVKKSLKMYIYERDQRKCRYCGKELSVSQISLDHYLPRCSCGTGDIFNLVLSCRKCNNKKRNIVPEDYEEVLTELFKKAVKDRKIVQVRLKLKYSELLNMVQSIDRLEAINKYIVFQSPYNRFYIKDNEIVKIIGLAGYEISDQE